MKTFLKVLLVLLAAMLLLKLVPLTLGIGIVLAVFLAGSLLAGLGAVALILLVALALAAALAPVWLPALAAFGIWMAWKKWHRTPA